MSPALAADLLVTFHFCYVGFTVGGEAMILLGWKLKWSLIRNRTFRVLHLAAMALVAVEALAGALCPLTVWEYALRESAGQQVERQISFVGRLIRSVIFYDFPAWVFTALYVGFTAMVALTFRLIPPYPSRRRRSG